MSAVFCPPGNPAGTRTLPSARSTAEVVVRLRFMPAVGVHVPVAGSKISAVSVVKVNPHAVGGGASQVRPPATRTLPSGSSWATWSARRVAIEPAGDQVPVAGLYSSAVARSGWALALVEGLV